MLDIRISPRYQALRRQELELTADYLQKKQEEKEAERAERERLREEAKAQAEFRREIEKLEKERKHLLNVHKVLLEKGDEEGRGEAAGRVGQRRRWVAGLARARGEHPRRLRLRDQQRGCPVGLHGARGWWRR